MKDLGDHEIIIQRCDTSTITDKLEESDLNTQEQTIHSTIRPAFICTAALTILFPILWFIITGMVSWSEKGYNNLWWAHLLGADTVADANNGRGITILLSFGWTFGLFLVFCIQGNNVLREIYGNIDISNKGLICCPFQQKKKNTKKKETTEHQGVDERKLGSLIGCLFCFSNLCFILCFSIAWPSLETNFNWESIISEKLTIPLATLLWAVWGFTFSFMFSVLPNKQTQSTTATDRSIKICDL